MKCYATIKKNELSPHNNQDQSMYIYYTSICLWICIIYYKYILWLEKDKKPQPELLTGISSVEEIENVVDENVICSTYSMVWNVHSDNLFMCYLYNKQSVSKQQQRIKSSKELGGKRCWFSGGKVRDGKLKKQE